MEEATQDKPEEGAPSTSTMPAASGHQVQERHQRAAFFGEEVAGSKSFSLREEGAAKRRMRESGLAAIDSLTRRPIW